MMKHSFHCLLVVIFFLPNVKADGGAVIGIIVGVGLGVIFLISLSILGCYCYRKRLRLKESNNYVNRITAEEHLPEVTTQRRVFTPAHIPPPSYSLTDPQSSSRSSGNNSNSNIHIPKDQPPPYSANIGIYHTCASGQPFQGRDNPAFLNESLSSFSDFPSMGDILLTSSKTSLPAAVSLESHSAGRKQKRLSDSAKGTSLESRTFPQGRNYIRENQHFSLSLEEEHQEPINVLNECFESYSNSDSETTDVDMTGNWLDSIKNQSLKNHTRPNSQTNQTKVKSLASGSNKNSVASIKSQSKPVAGSSSRAIPQNGLSSSTSQNMYKKKPQQNRTRIESSDSGADMSQDVNMNPKGHKNGQKRFSKISSDSGLGEQSSSSHLKSKHNSKLNWEVVDSPSTQHASRSTEV